MLNTSIYTQGSLASLSVATHLHIESDVSDGTSAIIEVYGEVLQLYLLLQVLPQIVLQEIAACPFLDELWDREKPRHFGPLGRFSPYYLSLTVRYILLISSLNS